VELENIHSRLSKGWVLVNTRLVDMDFFRQNHRLIHLAPALVVTLGLLLSSCASDPTATPAASLTLEPTMTLEPTNTPEVISGIAQVDSVTVQLLETWPVQANVVVKGILEDGCTTIDEIRTDTTDDGFTISITTVRPADMICTQALVPYEEDIPLDILGLAAGSYTVNVNGVKQVFTLDADNVQVGQEDVSLSRFDTSATVSILAPTIWDKGEDDTWVSSDGVSLSVKLLDVNTLADAETSVSENKEVLSRLSVKLSWGTGILLATQDNEDALRQYQLVGCLNDQYIVISLSAADRTLLEDNSDLFEQIYNSVKALEAEADYETGMASVETATIEMTDSVPIEATAIIEGYLADGCTEIDAVDTTYDALTQTFHVSIETIRPTDAVCTEATVPFEQRVPLQVYGLAAGEYTVEVNGVSTVFVLERDNRSYASAVSQEGMVTVQLPEYSLVLSVPEAWEQTTTGWLAEDGTVIGVDKYELEDGETLLDVLPTGSSITSCSTPNLDWSGALRCLITSEGQIEDHVLVVLDDGSVLDMYRRTETEEQLGETQDLFMQMCQSVELES